MAVEVHVFFRGKLPTKSALTKAMKELGFPISIKPARGSLEKQSGFMPMSLRGEEAGVEFDVFDGRANIEESGVENIDPSYDRTASFRWGGDESEMLCGLCAAAALAKLMNGVVFDEDNVMSADDAIEIAQKALGKPEKSKGKREPGTRPADIKRYLKPLLELRSDLVLIGRQLVVRPVRHILRGAFLDSTRDKYSFRVYRYTNPLVAGDGGGLGISDRVFNWAWQVWQPHFQPLLFDVLAEEIFGRLGKLTTFDAWADELIEAYQRPGLHTTAEMNACVVAPVLAGRPESAATFIREIERNDPGMKYWVKQCLEFLARDINTVCAEFHDREAKAAKQLKLGDIWEPSPFPAELPPAQRAEVAEPLFAPTPWIARPPDLLGAAPERPGEVRFAKRSFWRNGRVVLLVPLTVREAEERHREGEDYVLVTQIEGGLLLVLKRLTGWDRLALPQPPVNDLLWRLNHSTVRLHLHSASHDVVADFSVHSDGDLPRFWTFTVSEDHGYWKCHLDFRDGERSIHDNRSGKLVHTTTPLTSADVTLASRPMPAFGEFEDLMRRLRALLQSTGYGEFP